MGNIRKKTHFTPNVRLRKNDPHNSASTKSFFSCELTRYEVNVTVKKGREPGN